MAALSDLKDIARRTGEKRFPQNSLADVLVDPAIGADGSDILSVRFVMDEATINRLDGDTLVDTIVELSNAFQDAGDDRHPMVNYVTPAETEEDGHPES